MECFECGSKKIVGEYKYVIDDRGWAGESNSVTRFYCKTHLIKKCAKNNCTIT